MISKRAASFQESVIREMTRLHAIYGGVNLAQGFPDFDPPPEIVEAAVRALRDGYNQYAITWGAPRLREALARKVTEFNRIPTDPQENVTVTCGATEAMIATLMAILNPGDAVILFAPFYENYGPDAVLSGAEPQTVFLRPEAPGGGGTPSSAQKRRLRGGGGPSGGAGPRAIRAAWGFDVAELEAAVTPRTRAIIVNTPHNPTGHVFTRAELEAIAGVCCRHNLIAVTDEIYEHILYDGREHVSLGSLPGMGERTVTISGFSKTFAVTGWRLGYAVAPAEMTVGIRRVHDFLTVGAPHPLQEAAAAALALPPSYYAEMTAAYTRRRDRMLGIARAAGFGLWPPEGAYYLMTDITSFGFPDDVTFARHMVEKVGVAVVPGSSFYPAGAPDGRQIVRFAFPKQEPTFAEAERRLATLTSNSPRRHGDTEA